MRGTTSVDDAASQALLEALLAADIQPRGPRPADQELLLSLLLAPIAAPSPPPAADRLNLLLLRSAYVLAGASVVLCGFWLANGLLYDWSHMSSAYDAARTARPPAVVSELSIRPRPTASPFIIPTRPPGAGQQGDFLAPERLLLRPLDPATALPAWIQIPSIQVDSPVVEIALLEDGWQSAEYAVGHLRGTGLPGERGNAVFAGHLGLRGGVFHDLGRLQPGDDLLIYTSTWRFVYRVRSSQVVWPSQVEVLQSGPTATATLITCTNFDLQRLVVTADLTVAAPISPP